MADEYFGERDEGAVIFQMLDEYEREAVFRAAVFRSLDEAGRSRLWPSAQLLVIKKDHVIVREGEIGNNLYIIQQGTIGIFTTNQDETILLDILNPGDCFGEVALLTGCLRTATAVALEDCRVVSFPKDQVEDAIKGYPEVRKDLEDIVVNRANATIKKIV